MRLEIVEGGVIVGALTGVMGGALIEVVGGAIGRNDEGSAHRHVGYGCNHQRLTKQCLGHQRSRYFI